MILGLIVLLVASLGRAENVKQLVVTGNRVSLRAAPKLDAVLLARSMFNDELFLADDSNPEWVGVRPPERIDLWVKSEYVENGKVKPARLNVRSGPSLSHQVVGEAVHGEELISRGNLSGWLRIAPPAETVVWISRKYIHFLPEKKNPVLITVNDEMPTVPERADRLNDPDAPVLITLDSGKPSEEVETPRIHIQVEPSEPARAEIVDPNPAPSASKKKIKKPVLKVAQPVINDVLIAAASISDLPKVLKPASDKKQGTAGAFSGLLKPANNLLYKLVDPASEEFVVCYVRGNSVQMEAFSDRTLRISGRVYWGVGIKQPLLVPEKIKIIRQPTEE